MEKEKLSDEDLVELVRSKDQELYRVVVERYQSRLLRFATYLIKDPDKAADVVQEAFIKAFINLKGFKTKKKFSSWIYRIVHNEAINQIKKEKKKISFEENDWLKQLASKEVSMEEKLVKKEARIMVKKCLNQLPLVYRSPLTLFYLEERSYEEISDILKIPVGTVGTRINRGKKMMKVIIGKKEIKTPPEVKTPPR